MNEEDTIAQVISMLLEYGSHKTTCPKAEDDRKTCDCGFDDAINTAIRFGHAETTIMARWQQNGSGY